MDHQKIDDFFKQKFEERSFEMKDEYWQNAERMIEEDRRRRRFGFFRLWGLLALLLVGIIGAWLFLFSKPSKTNLADKTDAKKITRTQSNPSTATIDGEDQAVNEQVTDGATSNDQTTASISTTEQSAPPSKQTTENKSASTAVNDTKLSSDAANPHPHSLEDAGSAVSSETKSAESAGSTSTVRPKPSTIEDQAKQEQTSSQNATTKGVDDTKVDPSSAQKTKTAIIPDETDAKNPNNLSNQAIENNKETKANDGSPSLKDQNNAFLAEQLRKQIGLPFAPEFLESINRLRALKDSLEYELLPEQADSKKLKQRIKHWNLGIAAGLDLFPEKMDTMPLNVGYQFGLSLRYRFNNKWALQSGLLFTNRERLFNEATDRIEQIEYSFGRSERIYNITGKHIYTFELPVNLEYSHRRHSLEAGLQLNYLLGGKGDLGGERFLFPWERSDLNFVYEEIAEEAIKFSGKRYQQFYLAVQAGYHFQLTPNWQIGLQARWVPGENIEAGANHFRLGMRYYFLKW